MADWVNKGSCRDISDLAMHSIGVRTGSMAATNTVSVTPDFGAPGTESESETTEEIQDAPDVLAGSEGPKINPGDDGKPQARTDSTPAPSPTWKPTTIPDVKRTQ